MDRVSNFNFRCATLSEIIGYPRKWDLTAIFDLTAEFHFRLDVLNMQAYDIV